MKIVCLVYMCKTSRCAFSLCTSSSQVVLHIHPAQQFLTWFPEGSIKMATRAYPTARCSEDKRSRVSTLIITVLVISMR